MRKYKTLFVGLLCVLFGMMLSFTVSTDTSAAGLSLQQLQSKFPNGAYWNHIVQSGHRYSNYQDVGPCNNPDGYTWTPCYSHNADAPIGQYDCNSFQNGMQCNGFARKLAYDVYGSTHVSWGRTNIANAKPGDVIHYTGAGAHATYGHWAMIIGKNGTILSLGEANVGGNCKISWGRTINANSMASYEIYSAPYQLPVQTNITYSNYQVEVGESNNFVITAEINNPAGYAITEIGHKFMDEKGNLIGENQHKIEPFSNVKGKQSIKFEYLKSSTTYQYQFFVIAYGKTFSSEVQSFTTPLLYGDADLSGRIEASDALVVLKSCVKLTTLSPAQTTSGDVDGNAGLSANDALVILKKVVNLITRFPVEG